MLPSLVCLIGTLTRFRERLTPTGVGGVGRCFLQQLAGLPDTLRPSLVFVSRSTKNIASEDYRPIQVPQAETLLNSSSTPMLNLFELATYLARAPGRALLVHNTS